MGETGPEELDTDAVTDDLARSVHAALEPAHVSVWLADPLVRRSPGRERPG